MIGSKYNGGYFSADVFWEGHSHLDFDKRQIRKAMRAIGADLRKVARKLVSRRAVSSAGEAPGKRTGTLQRAIKYKVSKPGLLVRIAPDKTEAMGNGYYPAFLNYGVRRNRSAKAAKGHKRQPSGQYKLEPRENYMEKALDERRENARQVLAAALDNALIARK